MERVIRYSLECLPNFDQKLTLEQEHIFVNINYVFFQISDKGWNKYLKKASYLSRYFKNSQRHIIYGY